MTEDDDQPRPAGAAATGTEDNSLGRLLTLSDGIFAIAMTLLALDLKVPGGLGSHPSDATLRHALARSGDSYWSYLLTFYVVAGYWARHRHLMRSVVAAHPVLIRDSLLLLVVVAAMPFPASLLGRYGGDAISLALYGAMNAVATLILMLLSWDVRRLHLAAGKSADDYVHQWRSWVSLAVFLLCIPAGYLFGTRGLWVFALLAIPSRYAALMRGARKLRRTVRDR